MDIVPLKTRVLGQLLGQSAPSSTIWMPTIERNVRQLMRVTAVGDAVKGVAVDDVVVLPDIWSGATLAVYDDETHEREEHFIIEEKDLLAKIVETENAS